MANPRKFSEKIALHTQKQAEETAEYEKIMREVKDCTSRSTLSNLEEMKCGRGDSPVTYGVRGRSVGVGVGPMRPRTAEKRVDISPYSGPYLSPPPDTSWRRTNSDSALHTTSSQGTESLHSPGSQRRVHQYSSSFTSSFGLDGHGQHDGYETPRRHLSVSPDGRPRSCCDVPRVPGIHIFPTQQEPGTVQIPIGNNTGSLPDLTSFHFPSPLPTPLDQEDHNSSPYSNSPQGTSPSTLSPSSVTTRHHGGRFSFGGSPPNESPGPPHYSPHSPSAPTPNHLSVPLVNSRFLHTCKGVTVENNVDGSSYQHHHQQQQQSQQQQTTQQSSPSKQHQHQHQHQQQQQQHQQQQQQQQQQSPQQHQFVYQTSPSPQPPPPQQPLSPHGQTTPPSSVNIVNSLNSYRSPQPVNRPSPQNSPGLAVKYGSASPISSSPQSPSSPSSTSGNNPFSEHNSYYFIQAQANALQQHFEQFNMMDSPVSGNIDYIGSTNAISPYTQTEDNCPQELTQDPGYFSTSPSQQLQYPRTTNSTHTTPNTPSSIPDIVLTDFSSPGEDLGVREHPEEFAKELGCAITGSFDSDLFPSDECLRAGLDPIDLDGLQMLTDQEVITDPATEDHFRLDRL